MANFYFLSVDLIAFFSYSTLSTSFSSVDGLCGFLAFLAFFAFFTLGWRIAGFASTIGLSFITGNGAAGAGASFKISLASSESSPSSFGPDFFFASSSWSSFFFAAASSFAASSSSWWSSFLPSSWWSSSSFLPSSWWSPSPSSLPSSWCSPSWWSWIGITSLYFDFAFGVFLAPKTLIFKFSSFLTYFLAKWMIFLTASNDS